MSWSEPQRYKAAAPGPARASRRALQPNIRLQVTPPCTASTVPGIGEARRPLSARHVPPRKEDSRQAAHIPQESASDTDNRIV